MTVRWKPLLILSGVFVVIAVVGLLAMAYTLLPRGAADILPLARAERTARKYDNALLQYRRALQQDGKNASIHEEVAAMYAEWADQPGTTPEKKSELRAARLEALANAAKAGKSLKEPRRLLLEDALRHDEASLALSWAKELLRVDPRNAEAHYVIAAEALEHRNPDLPELKRDLEVARGAHAPAVRITWIKARISQLTSDSGTLRETLAQARGLSLPATAGPVDRMALLRLKVLDIQTNLDTTTPAEPLPGLAARVESLKGDAEALLKGANQASGRIVRVSLLLEQIQRGLQLRAANPATAPATRTELVGLVDSIEQVTDAIFQKSMSDSAQPDLQVALSYADHLRFRGKRDACIKVIDTALKSPAATRKNSGMIVMALHALAAETALANLEDKARFEVAAPHIKELIACSYTRYQGLGHLFQGAVELEQAGTTARSETAPDGPIGLPPAASGAAQAETVAKPASTTASASAAQAKLRASALAHLKTAAELLPDVAEAQARYGVALVLSTEPVLGRQYLQKAVAQGSLDPQYQIWAAWSMVQAGYPEEAEPIVAHLFEEVAQGRQPRGLEGTLHLLSAEIHQARKTPDELNKAAAEYDRSIANGQPQSAAILLRLAQIDIQLGRPEAALKRIDALRAQGQGGPSAEQLAVATLQQMGQAENARKVLDEARVRYPGSEDLAGLDATLRTRAGQPAEADRVLGQFLDQHPESVSLTIMRAHLLADVLDNPREARTLLVNLAERSDNSAPLVELALLDLKQKDYDAVAITIAKIRSRWKEAASADLLDAQLALDQGNLAAASASFDTALKKDPRNKMVQFWKAELDSRNGAAPEAAKTFEAIVKERPTKQLDSGLSLTDAAESALANLALANGDLDTAIERFEELRAGAGSGTGAAAGLTRADRWQLVAAYNAKGDWAGARREIANLLNDPKNPATNDERVRAATYYRQRGETAAAEAQADYVLKLNPNQPAAVITRALLLAETKKFDDARTMLQQAIKAASDKPQTVSVYYLLLAAVENWAPPKETAADRALAAVDQGLAVRENALELIKARYGLLRQTRGGDAALAFLEEKARVGTPSDATNGDKTKDKDKDQDRKDAARGRDDIRRMLVEVYAERKNYGAAEQILRDLLQKNPKDATVAANLVRLATLESIAAGAKDDPSGRRTFEDKAAALVREFRTRFPTDLTFLQLDCDLAARRGDLTRAAAITQEMDNLVKSSTIGPLTRARIYGAQGRTREVATAYEEALERNPRLS